MPVWLTAKLMTYGAIGIVSVVLSMWLYGAVKNHFNDINSLEEALANERIARNRVEVSLKAERETIALKEQHLKDLTAIRDAAQKQIDDIRTQAEKDKEVLYDRERFARVVEAKPELVEKLSNKATKRVFEELTTIINN